MSNEVSITVNTKSNVKKGMDQGEREAKEGSKRINESLKAIGEIAAGEAVIEFGKGLFEAAEQAEKANKLTEQAIKSTGGAAHVTAEQIAEYSTQLSKQTGVEDDVIHSGANLLLTFTNIKNGVGKGNDIFNQAQAAALDMTSALNQGTVTTEGLKSSSIQLGKALNDPIKGITALQRVGVSFTEDQKKAIAADVKRGDTMKAQKIILAELNKEFGGAAAAQATPADKAKAAWHDFQETLGEKLMPTIDKLLERFTEILPKIIAIALAIGNFAAHNKLLVEIILAIVAAVKLWSVAQAILDAEFFASPIGPIIAGVTALTLVIVYLATKTRFFQDVWKAVWGFLKGVADWFVNGWGKYLLIALGPVGLFILAGIELIKHWGSVLDFFKGVGHWFSHDFVGFFMDIGHWFTHDFVGFFMGIGHWFTTDFVGFFIGVGHNIEAAWDTMFHVVRVGFADFVNGLLVILGLIIKGAATAFGWIPGIGGKLKRASKEFDQFRADVNRSLLGIHDRTINLTIAQRTQLGGSTGPLKVGGGLAHGGIAGAAVGLIANGLTMVGEHGPELADLAPGTRVYSNPDSQRMLAGLGGRGGGAVVLVLESDDDLLKLLLTKVRVKVRVDGAQATLGVSG